MAGNNDEKIVRLPQLDRLTKSLDARNSTIIQNVHDELISAVEDVEKKLFSKDYNDLTNKPLVNTVINEKTILAEWDGNEAGRSIGSIPTISCSNCVKVADLTEDQQLEYFEKINTNGCIITIDPGDGILIEQVVDPGKGYAFMDYCNFIKPETNGRALVVLSGKAWSWYINHADQYINDPGIYFYNVDGYKVVKLEILDEINQCVSANDIFVNDKKLATEDFVNNAIDNIPEGFSGDYNDLTNKPCYEISELKLFTNDGDNTGRLIVDKGTTNVKFAKISEDEIESNLMDQARFSMFVGDEGYEVSDPSTFIIVENETGSAINLGDYVICTFNDNFAMDMSGTIVTFPEKGLYFSFNASSGHEWRLDNVYLPVTSAKQLDEKFIPDTIARMDDIIELEEDILSMEGMIDNTYPNLITQDKTILGAINELARMLNGLTLMPITQEAYDALAEKNPNVIYIVTE